MQQTRPFLVKLNTSPRGLRWYDSSKHDVQIAGPRLVPNSESRAGGRHFVQTGDPLIRDSGVGHSGYRNAEWPRLELAALLQLQRNAASSLRPTPPPPVNAPTMRLICRHPGDRDCARPNHCANPRSFSSCRVNWSELSYGRLGVIELVHRRFERPPPRHCHCKQVITGPVWAPGAPRIVCSHLCRSHCH